MAKGEYRGQRRVAGDRDEPVRRSADAKCGERTQGRALDDSRVTGGTPKALSDAHGAHRHAFAAASAPSSLSWMPSNPPFDMITTLSLIHISEPTRLLSISYAVF